MKVVEVYWKEEVLSPPMCEIVAKNGDESQLTRFPNLIRFL